jgi:hypothetical protein
VSAIQELHDSEVNGGLAWPEQGRILVYLGCPLDPPPHERMLGEALVDSFAEAEDWLRNKSRELCGEAFEPPARNGHAEPVVQRLFEAGISGSVYWVYDGAFGVTLADREGGVNSWAEAEAWLAEHAWAGEPA